MALLYICNSVKKWIYSYLLPLWAWMVQSVQTCSAKTQCEHFFVHGPGQKGGDDGDIWAKYTH